VVVGFDASVGSVAAVNWAAREAVARGASLRIVSCWAVPPEVDYYYVGARQAESLRTERLEIEGRYPSLEVELASTHLDPRDALVDESGTADLLVVGSSDSGAAKRLLLGSVARTAARRSRHPVVVVRGESRSPLGRIAVAVDGSSAANAAIDWACAEAALHNAELVVVHAWDRSVPRAEAQNIVDVALDRCRARGADNVHGQLVDDSPSSAIVDASRDADLIAIGSRGRSGFKTKLFGSVALFAAEHTDCPVVVTHPSVASR
jgi:nucleotide-binding universal stress UspA family protein